MVMKAIPVIGALLLLAGCATTDTESYNASPATEPNAYRAWPEATSGQWACEQAGGRWSPTNTWCVYPRR
jgi:hypothetical protein